MNYVVYLTMYKGTKLPKWYIGSTNKNKINEGYHGSVASEEWSTIFKEEEKNSPHLFKTRILSFHKTRDEALKEEYRVQQIHDAPRNKKYINKAFATSFIGGDTSKYIDYTKIGNKVSESMLKTNIKKYGEFKDFEVICHKCDIKFIVNERELQHPKKEKYFCSRSCANSKVHSEETKQKQREATLKNKSFEFLKGATNHKNTKLINKNGITKRIKPEQIDEFIQDGWVFGRTKSNQILIE